MSDIPWLRLLGRVVVFASIGLVISLLAGTLISLAPESPLEGIYGGVFATGALLTLVYFFALLMREKHRLNAWIFDLHSILGLITGILLSVIFVSGVLLLYRAEIDVFANSWLEINAGESHVPVDSWIDAVGSRTDLNSSSRIDINWPDSPTLPVRVNVNGPNGLEQFHVDPYSANVIDGAFNSKMEWVRGLHVSLNLGIPGHWLSGLVALAAIWLCISGLTMGRNVFSKWYQLRWRAGMFAFISDLHKRIGLWLLPFIALNAFAGMMAALFSVFSAGPIEMRFEGSYSAFYEAVGSPPSIVKSDHSATPSMQEFVAIAQNIMPDADLRQIRIYGYGDRNSIISIRASRSIDLAPRGSSLLVNIRASTGEILLQRKLENAGIFEKISMALASFHFAEYGGRWVRRIHAITAITISLLPMIGMMIWFLRRRRVRPHKSEYTASK